MTDRSELSSWARQLVPDKANRHKDDWYATPASGTAALLRHEGFAGRVWEPACGDGAMSRVLAGHGLDVYSTDLVDRGFGEGAVDFLMERDGHGCSAIITNPPFKLAEEFVRHGLDLVDKVAVLLRLQFLEGMKRQSLFTEQPFKKVLVFSDRLPMWPGGVEPPGQGGRMVAFAWFIWDRAYQGPSLVEWCVAGFDENAAVRNGKDGYTLAIEEMRKGL
jgi:hypothetical protein